MLETFDAKIKIEKETYLQWFPRLQTEIRELQQRVREARLPVMVIFEGFRLSGRSDAVWYLGHALDPRGFIVHSRSEHLYNEQTKHWLWRYWIRTPSRGKIALFEHSWYHRVLSERVFKECTPEEWARAFQEINQTEEMLADDGTLIIKFWLHITRKTQKKRIRKAEENPYGRYTVSDADWKEQKRFAKFAQAAEEMMERTSTHYAPWTVVEAGDARYRRLKVFQSICERVAEALNAKAAKVAVLDDVLPLEEQHVSVPALEEMPTVLDKVDFDRTMSTEEYDSEKERLQLDLRRYQYKAIEKGLPLVIVFEGWDAAGKGGAIRRLTANLDPRHYDVIPISKPTEEDLAHHYLWRFWRYIPSPGHTTVYDRSWYGRVMVERIEGFCSEADWKRAYQEINEFEMQLYREGVVIVKFWLHITSEEQLRRFKARESDPLKRWKLTAEDWRNRDKWDEYYAAVEEMLTRTSTTYAPWHIVPANCKRSARLQCLSTVIDVIKDCVGK